MEKLLHEQPAMHCTTPYNSLRFLPGCFILLIVIMTPRAQATRPTTEAWSKLNPAVQKLIDQLLQSPDWPMRAITLMRLERYEGEDVHKRVLQRIGDSQWQIRCFALRLSQRMGLKINPDLLTKETDPRVMRIALRSGVKLNEETIRNTTQTLLPIRGVEQLMLGVELAVASNQTTLKEAAQRRLERIISNMDDMVATQLSRRLAILLQLQPEPADLQSWRTWLNNQGGKITLPASSKIQANNDPRLLAAELDDEEFAALIDYLGALRRQDLDLVLVMDATSSMLPMINQARVGVSSLIFFLSDISGTMRLAFVAYRDHDNKPVWEGHPFTNDVESIRQFLFDVKVTGGADLPEAVMEGLEACGELDWNRRAAREIILIGDAPPHEEDLYRVQELAESYQSHGVVLHAVHVPMRYPDWRFGRMSTIAIEQQKAELLQYNDHTSQVFGVIAETGGGRLITMNHAEQLVPSIMHCAIEEAWWPVFDEFYDQYLELCR